MSEKSLKEIYEEYKGQYPGIVDFSAVEDDGILDFFETKIFETKHKYGRSGYPKIDTPREECFYGGITNDITGNLSRHNISSYICCVFVDSFETAERIEGLLPKLGVDIGKRGEDSAGNGGKNKSGEDDSRVVYLADKTTPGFKR